LSRKSGYSDPAGFTLIEALVALAIIAIVLSPIAAMIATTTKGSRLIDQRLALAGAAETLLAALPARNLLTSGGQSGETAGHRWRIDISQINTTTSSVGRWIPLSVAMRLQAPGGPAMQVTTVRLVPAPQ
jgi:general secretion pathway protein I